MSLFVKLKRTTRAVMVPKTALLTTFLVLFPYHHT